MPYFCGMENEIVILDSIEKFNRQCGFETLHPLVAVVDMAEAKGDFGTARLNYGLYALWLKNGVGCSLKYGRRHYDYAEVSKDIDELIELSKQYDNMATVKKMKEIVPEYKSNNSVYEVLDQ